MNWRTPSRWGGRVIVIALALLLIAPPAVLADDTRIAKQTSDAAGDNLLVYHQITNLPEDSGGVGQPVLSADGERAVFTDSPGSGDPATPNRIYVINADGSGLTEVDAYQTLCYCGSEVDISDDGQTVVSTESVQVRIADAGGGRELINLASGEITAVKISGDGTTVFFIVRRDTATRESGETIARGVWRVDADGSNLRQVVGAEEVAEALGVPIEATGCCFHGDWSPLDVSSDGSSVVFAAFAEGSEYVFAVDGAGGEPLALSDPMLYVRRVAISGDGTTVGYDVIPPDTNGVDEIGVVGFDGSDPRTLATGINSDASNLMQLNADGSRLLVSHGSFLFDTASGEVRQLAVVTPGADHHTALLTEGMARATMNADATRFLYAIRTSRCADCPNWHEQLATLDIGPADPGEAPAVADPTLDPAEIPLDYQAAATASAAVEVTGELLAVGLVALRDGYYDVNVGRGAILHDDGLEGDTAAGDGIFTNNAILHIGAEAREDDTGPRMLRIQAEAETADGLRHATAVEFGPLVVVKELR